MSPNPSYFDVGFGLASVALSVSGITIIATTESAYYGVSAVPAATNYTILVYDSLSAATGNLLDAVLIASTGNGIRPTQFIPIKAKKGIVASITGTAGSGTVFYGPKG